MSEQLPEVTSFLEAREKSPAVWHEQSEVSSAMIEIAESVGELTGTWNPVEIYTPSPESLKQEKEKFLEAFNRGQAHEPVFDYQVARGMDIAPQKEELAKKLAEVRAIKPRSQKDRLFRVALYTKIRDDLATCDLVDGINTKDESLIGSAMRQKYQPANPVLAAYAEQAYRDMIDGPAPKEIDPNQVLLTPKQQKLLKAAKLDAPQIKEAFEWALQQYGILRNEANSKGYQVVISDKATAIDVRDKSEDPMTVYIPTDRVVSGDKMGELIAHEIEGHARQSMNGMEMFLLGGGKLKMDGEALYEGLAKREDESYRLRFFGEASGVPAPWYTLAAQDASEGASFSEVFQNQYIRRMRVLLKVPPEQELHIDPEKHAEQADKAKKLAWATTYRVMRGHADMSNPLGFAMSKDIGYLQGWATDKQLGEAGYGGINEMAVIQSGGLQMLARLGVNEKDVPHKYKDVVKEYILTVLLPRLESEPQQPAGETLEGNSHSYTQS